MEGGPDNSRSYSTDSKHVPEFITYDAKDKTHRSGCEVENTV